MFTGAGGGVFAGVISVSVRVVYYICTKTYIKLPSEPLQCPNSTNEKTASSLKYSILSNLQVFKYISSFKKMYPKNRNLLKWPIKKPLISERLCTWSGNRTHTPKYTSLSRARLPIPPSRLVINGCKCKK